MLLCVCVMKLISQDMKCKHTCMQATGKEIHMETCMCCVCCQNDCIFLYEEIHVIYMVCFGAEHCNHHMFKPCKYLGFDHKLSIGYMYMHVRITRTITCAHKHGMVVEYISLCNDFANMFKCITAYICVSACKTHLEQGNNNHRSSYVIALIQKNHQYIRSLQEVQQQAETSMQPCIYMIVKECTQKHLKSCICNGVHIHIVTMLDVLCCCKA